jgi:hypothetical protein
VPALDPIGSIWFIRRKRAPGLRMADMLIPFGIASKGSEPEVRVSTSLLYHAFSIRGDE